jgi:hypothetical protein
MVHYEWANRAQGRFMKSWLTLLPQTTRFHRNTYRNKKLEATEADECIVVDYNEYSKDIGSDDDDEDFTGLRNFEFLRTNPTRNTKANQDEDEERSSDAKRKSNSPALSANKK